MRVLLGDVFTYRPTVEKVVYSQTWQKTEKKDT